MRLDLPRCQLRQCVWTMLCSFAKNRRGVTAIEFALIAPIFFLLVFATFEIALVILYQNLLNDGANEASRYLRNETMNCTRQGSANNNCTAASVANVRQAVCGMIQNAGMSCGPDRLKIALYSADNLGAASVVPPIILDNVALDLASSRAYIVAVGYEWPFGMPTSRLLLPNQGDRIQVQSRVYATTAEKALR